MKAKFVDITGRVFCDLTAVEFLGTFYDGRKQTTWKWCCVCGKEVVYPLYRVTRGHTLSCGCRRSRDVSKIKLCRHCGEESFKTNRHGNPSSVCGNCSYAQGNRYKESNPVVKLVNGARGRAKKAGVPFDLTRHDLTIPEFCPVLGLKLEFGKGGCTDSSPSLDRIIPEKGYVLGNVAIMSFRANTPKSNGTAEELRRIAEWMDEEATKTFVIHDDRVPASADKAIVFREAQRRRRARERMEKTDQCFV